MYIHCLQPFDVLRTRMQADAATGVTRNTADTLKLVLHEYGVRGLWRGTGPTVVRLSLGAAINFVVLEKLKCMALQHLQSRQQQEGQHAQLGYLESALVGGE